MSGPIKRTWSVCVGTDTDFTVRAYDEQGAINEAFAHLGYDVRPCCELSEPCCAQCQKEADDDATERSISIARGK